MRKIIKRDGRKVPFNRTKIENAILKAFYEVDKEINDYAKDKARNIADYIAEEAKDKANSLKSAFDGYTSVVEKLNECTKGT